MRKMLVIFLILLTKVLADSEENNYVDLLPEEEKQQFLDKIARRILQDAEGQGNDTVATNKELIKQHTDYVKAIFKEEQANLRKSRGKNKEKDIISSSDEDDNLGVEPLKTKKKLNNKEEDNTGETTSNNKVTKKLSEEVQDEHTNNTSKSEETSSETMQAATNIKNDKSSELQSENEKYENSDIEEKVSSTSNSERSTKEKDPKVNLQTQKLKKTEPTNTEIEPQKSFNRFSEDEARNLSVKSIHERRTRKSAGILTENESKIPDFRRKLAENNTDAHDNGSSATDESTTLTYALESNSTKDSETESISNESNPTKDSVTESISSESNLTKDHVTESISTESVSKESNSSKGSVTESNPTQDHVTKSISSESVISENNSTTGSVTRSISGESDSIEQTTTNVPLPESTTITENKDKVVDLLMKSKNDTSESIENEPQTTVETSKTSTLADETSTDFVSETITETGTIEKEAESTNVPVTTEQTTMNIPVDTTEETKIVLEDFTSMPTTTSSAKTTKHTPKIKKIKKKTPVPQEVTTETPHSDEETLEAPTTKIVEIKKNKNKGVVRVYNNKQKAILHKVDKVIVGPKAKQNAKPDEDVQNKYFFDLKKVYYDNHVKIGKEYHVFEIPNGETPFVKNEDPVKEQPYYVPVYNYSPNNAYINPQNRLGPNAGGNEEMLRVVNGVDDTNMDDDYNINQQYDKSETFSFEMEYDLSNDRQRKKFGSKHSISHGIYKPAIHNNDDHNIRQKIHPEDYLDSDYYFGRLRKTLSRRELGKPDNSKNLKDHLREVRQILHKLKTFEILNNEADVSTELRTSKDRIDDMNTANNKNSDYQDDISVKLINEAENGNVNKNFKNMGTLNGEHGMKQVYVIDDFFKESIDKYIEQKVLTPTTSYLNEATSTKNLENRKNTTPPALDIKLNVRRNPVVKVSIYMQVLNDMITLDNKALIQYDWLGTTVDIQAALQKLFELTILVANNENIHPSDMEIVKYLLFLHMLATEINEASEYGTLLRRQGLPRNKKKKLKPRIINEKGLLSRIWLYIRKEAPKVDEFASLKRLNRFFMDIEDSLYDLHEAIKNIANITKFNNQHWYQNLKDLYIDLDDKHLLELLLHLTTLRLFSLVEESAKNGLEEDYIQYMKENRDHSKQTLQEMIFIMKILDEYKKVVV